MSKPFYMRGRQVVRKLLDDPSYVDVVLVYDQDRFPCAGLFEKRGDS